MAQTLPERVTRLEEITAELHQRQEQHRKMFADIGIQLTAINRHLDQHENLLAEILREVRATNQQRTS